MWVCFKFHRIAQKTVAREILAATSFKFKFRAASRLVSFRLSQPLNLSRREILKFARILGVYEA